MQPRKAYDFFARTMLKQLRARDPNVSMAEASGRLRQMWEALGEAERVPYVESERQDLERHEDEMTAYLTGLPDFLNDRSSLGVCVCVCLWVCLWVGGCGGWGCALLVEGATCDRLAPSLHSLPCSNSQGIRSMISPPGCGVVVLGSVDRKIRIWDIDNPTKSYILGTGPRTKDTPPQYVLERSGETDVIRVSGLQRVCCLLVFRTSILIHPPRPPSHTPLQEIYQEEAPNSAILPSRKPNVIPSQWHTDCVTALGFVNHSIPLLISGSRDGIVKVWR
jgi:hypothetical protein